MGVLEESLVQQLLNTSASYKRDVMEDRIRDLLGAEPFKDITGLPPRRGKTNGGIDGILYTSIYCDTVELGDKTALNIKVRKSDFTREQLGGFLLDMDREGINVGLIITAAYLSPDAKAEFNRKNAQGNVKLFHIRLSEILSSRNLPNIFINGKDVFSVLSENIRELITS